MSTPMCDRAILDPKFTSEFWRSLFGLPETRLALSPLIIHRGMAWCEDTVFQRAKPYKLRDEIKYRCYAVMTLSEDYGQHGYILGAKASKECKKKINETRKKGYNNCVDASGCGPTFHLFSSLFPASLGSMQLRPPEGLDMTLKNGRADLYQIWLPSGPTDSRDTYIPSCSRLSQANHHLVRLTQQDLVNEPSARKGNTEIT
jgi:hypothetical protein